MTPRVLFILKHRDHPWGCYPGYGHHLSSGLHNSARYVVEMLRDQGIPAGLVHVADNNFIDREVARLRPTHVVIEAYWVVPEKFKILRRLHPKVKWIIRNHSEIPFLANEGMTQDWNFRYFEERNVFISSNAPRATRAIRSMLAAAFPMANKDTIERKTPLLPNVYPLPVTRAHIATCLKPLRAGCFGAIRPLKNHLQQAIGAIAYCEAAGKRLEFHINSTRIEGGNPVLNNLRGLFDHMPRHKLIEHCWMDIGDFLRLVRRMDIVLQVSFSETFNFVAADAISEATPVVVSDEVPWASEGIANPASESSIAKAIERALRHPLRNLVNNRASLRAFSKESRKLWLEFLAEK